MAAPVTRFAAARSASKAECCIDDDCDPESCAVVSCYQGQCIAVSLCPPQGPEEILCCAHEGEPELHYCYVLEEGECCFDDECGGVQILNETCLVPACVRGLCVEFPDDDRCGKGEVLLRGGWSPAVSTAARRPARATQDWR